MFLGLGADIMFEEDTDVCRQYAEQGILYLIPYYNPWAWMNKQTVDYTDELVDVLFNEYGLIEDLPIVSTGGSMGGLSALVYAAYAKRTPVACVVNCPVCDLPYHFNERADLPRTLYSAFGTYNGTMEEALRSASPLDIAEKMPKTAKYYIFHCEEDDAVNKQKHSDRYVKKMSDLYDVEYYSVPNRGHCDLTDEMRKKYDQCILKSIYDAAKNN